jgi:opacity protein-like surface antigen
MRLHHFLLTSLSLLLISQSALADYSCCEDDDDDDYNDDDRSYDYLLEGDFELSLLVGIATIKQSNSTIQSDLTQTDTLVQDSSDWDSWTGQFGIGYEMPLYWSFGEDDEDYDEYSDISWFNTLTPQLNVYILGGGSLDGDVLIFGEPNRNDATYDMDFHSTRLMFDLAFDVLTVRDFSFYGLAGLGIAWNTTDFSYTPNPDSGLKGGYNLEDTDTSGFAYEFGAGVDYAVLADLEISLQYLYTVFNDVNVSGNNDVVDFEASSSDMDIKAQSILLGVRLSI